MVELKRLVVKADPWKVFFVFVGAILIYEITPDEQSILKIVASTLLAVVIFGWFLILGTSLNDNLPEDQQKSDALFIISCFYGMLLMPLSEIFKVTQIEMIVEFAFVLFLTFGLSFFYILYFTSVLYVSNQERFLEEKERLSAQVVFILFITFILGVLVFQSRVRKFFD